jgi:hypothetical protein
MHIINTGSVVASKRPRKNIGAQKGSLKACRQRKEVDADIQHKIL